MTVTEQQVLELEQNFVKEVDTHKNWNELWVERGSQACTA